MYFLKVRLEKGQTGRGKKSSLLGLLEYKSPFMMAEDETWVPEADLYETEHSYVLRVNVAGVKKNHLDLTLYGDSLKVSGRRTLEEEEVLKYHKLEMRQGSFERRFRLPEDIDRDSIEAVLSEGILTIRMKKRGSGLIELGS